MRPARTNRLARTVAFALWCVFSWAMHAQEGSQCCDGTRITFPPNSPPLTSTADVQGWVSSQLSRHLGLAPSDRLEVGIDPRSLRDHSIYTLAQTSLGIPIAHREFRLLLDEESRPIRFLGTHTPFGETPSTQPLLPPEQALAAARATDDYPATSKLVFWPDGSDLRLSYELEGVFEGGGDTVFERLYIDPLDGTVLERLSLTPQGFDAAVYDFAAACRDRRVRRRINQRRFFQVAEHAMKRHSSGPGAAPAGSDSERLLAMLRELYNFINATLELDSLDDRGAQLRAFVGVRFGSDNHVPQCVGDRFSAMWNGGIKAAFLPAAALGYGEILGHEVGHGLVQAGSGLIYRNQTGALNEAIADAMGVAFRAWLENRDAGNEGLPEDVPDHLWRIRTPGRIMRDLSAPSTIRVPEIERPYPDHFDDYWYVTVDNGGVHMNSSIMSHGFYLLAMGGQHRRLRSGPSVAGIGLLKAWKVFGRAAADLLTPNSSFEAARYAFADVAEILYGRRSPEWVATHTAMDAVGIPGYWDRPPPPMQTRDPEPTDVPKPSPPPASDQEPDRGPVSDAADDSETTPVPRPVPEPSPQREAETSNRDRRAPFTDDEPKRDRNPQPIPKRVPSDDRVPAPTDDAASGSADWVFPLVLALLALAAVAFALVKLRPGDRGGDTDSAPAVGDPSLGQAPGAVDRADLIGSMGVPPHGGSAGALVPIDGSQAIVLHSDLLVSDEGLVLGRSPMLCHVEIRDPRVSRRHLRLRLMDGAIWIEDLNSTSGTQVDGKSAKPFEPVQLGTGDLVHIANLPYRIQLP